MNVKLLRKIQKHILAEPRRLAMCDWIQRGKPGQELTFQDGSVIGQTYAECGTAACIAGWAVILSSKRTPKDSDTVLDRAIKILGITEYQSDSLFLRSLGWPQKFSQAYLAAKTPSGKARVAVRRIDHFIKTKGAE